MAKVVKVIELMSESPESWEGAVQVVVDEAFKTLRNIRSVYVKDFTAAVENGKVTSIASMRRSRSRWKEAAAERGARSLG